MKRGLQLSLSLAAMVLLATPAFSMDFKLSGFYNMRGIADNFEATNNYIGTLDDSDEKDQTLVDQRLRLKLDTKINDFLSFVYYAEVDMQWGDEQYSNNGRNDGGGIGGDTTNLETKQAYFDVRIPASTSVFRAGLQGVNDHYDYTLFAADMAGVKYTSAVGAADLTAGWFKLGEGDFNTADDVTLWALQADIAYSPNIKYGIDYYYYQNEGSQDYATFFGTTDIDAVLAFNAGGGDWTANRSNMDLHYLGGHGEYRLENLVLTGWVNGNFGTADDINNDTALPAVTDNIDVRGFAGRLNAATRLGPVQMRLAGTYFSGDDDLTDGEAGFIVNPMATETFAFATDGFMIFTPDADWNSVGQYGFAMMDAAYAGYGLGSVILTGSYVPTGLKNAQFRAGAGYFSSLEDELAPGDPRTDRSGTSLGTEIFLRAGYKVVENLDLSVNGAYAFLGDFYNDHGGGTAVNEVATDIDDPYEVYLKATLTF